MNSSKVIQSLKSSELFVGLSDEELRVIAQPARLMTVPKGRLLQLHSNSQDSVYLLKFGGIKVIRISPDGKELILDIIASGQMFGESSLLDDEPLDSMGVALEDSSVCVIPRAAFAQYLRRKPELLLRLAKLVGLRKRKIERRLEALLSKNVSGRLANMLLQLSSEYGVPDSRGTLLRIRLSQQEIGSFIGASREAVNQTLSDFRRQGLIDLEERRLIIRQRQSLQQL